MRIYHRYTTFDKKKKLLGLLDKLSIPYKEEKKSYEETDDFYFLEFFLFDDDPDFQEKFKQVEKFKLDPQVATEFSEEDHDNAKWFLISTGQFGYPQPEDDYFELTYAKENVCIHCKVGKKQINPFRLRSEPKQKHSQFLGLNWVFDEIFIRDAVKTVFEKEKVSGIYFSYPVFNKNGNSIEAIEQMHVDTILQQGVISNNLDSEICKRPSDKYVAFRLKTDSTYLSTPFCEQKKYNYPKRGMMTFKKELFDNQPDFVRTNEWFGSGASSSRPIIISKKVRDIIKQQKWRGAFLKPISII